jgi:DNA-binding LacI/PurR family transcriptional regulator
VRVSPRDMGRHGFEYADRLLSGGRPEPYLVPMTVVLRDSTGRR